MKTSLFLGFSEIEYQSRYCNIWPMMSLPGVSAQADLDYLSNFLGNQSGDAAFPANGGPALFVQSCLHAPDVQQASIIKDTRFGETDSAETLTQHLTIEIRRNL
jgi:hypothetical protein